ncbi:SAF domain-containing protein [Actinopolymorpha pittospori]
MSAVPSTPRRRLTDLTRAISWHRRLLAAGLAAASLALALHLLEPEPASTVTVLAAARDLAGGVPLVPTDLREVALPPSAVPVGALRPGARLPQALLAGPMRAGEPVTDARLLGPSLLGPAGSADVVAAPVRVADPGSLALVRVGDRIDLLAAETEAAQAGQPARVVASRARILALPGRPTSGGLVASGADQSGGAGSVGDGSGSGYDGGPLGSLTGGAALDTGPGAEGGLVVVSVPPDTAADLARAAVTARISLVLRGPT